MELLYQLQVYMPWLFSYSTMTATFTDSSCKKVNTVEPRYLKLADFELPLISKWKSGPCFNKKLWQQVTK